MRFGEEVEPIIAMSKRRCSDRYFPSRSTLSFSFWFISRTLGSGLCCPVVWVVEGGVALALGTSSGPACWGASPLSAAWCCSGRMRQWPSKERRSTATRLRAPLRYGSSICSCQIDANGARPPCVPAFTLPIACRAEGCGCAFRSRRRWHSSAPARMAGRRARPRRSAACRVRAARCRRWSPQGIRRS